MDDSIPLESLSEVFKCFICMEKLRDARLCPHCSKLCCYQCIRRWLNEQRPHCPHCRAQLRLTELVKCRWAEEVTLHIDSLSGRSARSSTPFMDNCEKHDEKLSVWCCICQQCICHHCALWGGQHSGHTLKPLDEVHEQRQLLLRDKVKLLRRRLTDLIRCVQDVERNIELVRGAKEQHVREIRCCVELMVARLDSQLKSKLVALLNEKQRLGRETEGLEAMLSEAERELAAPSKAQLVQRSDHLLQMFDELLAETMQVPPQVTPEFQSEIVPPYKSQLFALTEFSKLKAKADAVYSTPLACYGLNWRLKVYPDGNGVVRGNYLSVFLELSSGHPETAKCEYRVEMLHCSGEPGRHLIREFASEFEIGECWGYNRFFKLDRLLPEGFLGSDDIVTMQFHVRPPTYFQLCKELQWQVSMLEANESHYIAQINGLKERVALDLSKSADVGDIASTLSEVTIETEGASSEKRSQPMSNASTGMVISKEQDVLSNAVCCPIAGNSMTKSTEERDVDEETMSANNDVDQQLAINSAAAVADSIDIDERRLLNLLQQSNKLLETANRISDTAGNHRQARSSANRRTHLSDRSRSKDSSGSSIANGYSGGGCHHSHRFGRGNRADIDSIVPCLDSGNLSTLQFNRGSDRAAVILERIQEAFRFRSNEPESGSSAPTSAIEDFLLSNNSSRSSTVPVSSNFPAASNPCSCARCLRSMRRHAAAVAVAQPFRRRRLVNDNLSIFRHTDSSNAVQHSSSNSNNHYDVNDSHVAEMLVTAPTSKVVMQKPPQMRETMITVAPVAPVVSTDRCVEHSRSASIDSHSGGSLVSVLSSQSPAIELNNQQNGCRPHPNMSMDLSCSSDDALPPPLTQDSTSSDSDV